MLEQYEIKKVLETTKVAEIEIKKLNSSKTNLRYDIKGDWELTKMLIDSGWGVFQLSCSSRSASHFNSHSSEGITRVYALIPQLRKEPLLKLILEKEHHSEHEGGTSTRYWGKWLRLKSLENGILQVKYTYPVPGGGYSELSRHIEEIKIEE